MKKASARQGKPIPFHKLHGAGNDILVVESKDLPRNKAQVLRCMAHRQTGIGCDQVIEVLSRKPLKIQVWNGDGTKAEMCGNGARALLFLAAKQGWISRTAKSIPISISGKPYVALKAGKGYELCLGAAVLGEPERLTLGGEAIPFFPVSVGNPHCVVLEGENGWRLPGDYSLLSYGPRIEAHSRFSGKTNVEFVRSWEKKGALVTARVEVWERGAGATLSCGSGAVAVAAVLHRLSGANKFQVRMSDYTLQIRFEGGEAFLSGPSALVATGKFFF